MTGLCVLVKKGLFIFTLVFQYNACQMNDVGACWWCPCLHFTVVFKKKISTLFLRSVLGSWQYWAENSSHIPHSIRAWSPPLSCCKVILCYSLLIYMDTLLSAIVHIIVYIRTHSWCAFCGGFSGHFYDLKESWALEIVKRKWLRMKKERRKLVIWKEIFVVSYRALEIRVGCAGTVVIFSRTRRDSRCCWSLTLLMA